MSSRSQYVLLSRGYSGQSWASWLLVKSPWRMIEDGDPPIRRPPGVLVRALGWGGRLCGRPEWREVQWQDQGREGSDGPGMLHWMDGRPSPIARLWGGVGLGCDELTVGPGRSDTR